jgi:uncharacterized membrane protein
MSREQVIARERRWAGPVAFATFAATLLFVAGLVMLGRSIGASGESELLRNVDSHRSTMVIATVLQAIGVVLLALPLSYLFRAAEARSSTMRSQLIGVVIAGPIFLAIAYSLNAVINLHAATDFLSTAHHIGTDAADKAAQKAIDDQGLRSLAAGFGIGGQLGFAVAMVYTCLHALRVGLLTRFWGSLGMALGAVSFLFFQFALLWFVYLGLLISGRVPGGRPPAWEAGEAVPWPTPGQVAAGEAGDVAAEASGRPLPQDGDAEGSPGNPPRQRGERRKRKRRA